MSLFSLSFSFHGIIIITAYVLVCDFCFNFVSDRPAYKQAQKHFPMEENEFSSSAIKDMEKCAVIYRSNSSSFVYICFHCGADFNNIDGTLKHIETHFRLVQLTVNPIDQKDVKFECTETENASEDAVFESDNFGDASDTEVAIKAEIPDSDAECDVLLEEESTEFECKTCDSVFSSKFSLRSHTLKEHFKQTTLECGQCRKVFKREAAFKNHLKLHIDRSEVDWKCEADGIREPENPEQQDNVAGSSTQQAKPGKVKNEKQQSEKRKSEKSPSDKRKAKKPKAEKADKPEKSDKKKASKSNTEERTREVNTYVCHKCSDTYSTSNELNNHLSSHTRSNALQINKCKECKIFFDTDFDLRLHVLEIHLAQTEFQCATCFVEFKTDEKLLLERHLELHLVNHSAKWVNIRHGVSNRGMNATIFEEITTTSEFPCDLCDEKFYLRCNLEEHNQQLHTLSDDNLRCTQCEAVFVKSKVSEFD